MNIKKDILAALTYFNMFDYPLRKREILIFLPTVVEQYELDRALNILIAESIVFKIGEFYSIQNNFFLSERRINGNAKAAVMLQKAERIAAFLSGFPFVKAVSVSGSLSKNFADDTADIDFFIITAANRLWIARSFLHAFKKLTFLFNKQHYYCMNYFVDEAELAIVEKNIYTAMEIVTLLPLRGTTVFENFYTANNWTKNFLPNNYMRVSLTTEVKNNWVKWFIEKMLNSKPGNLLDSYLMNLTAKNWNKKTISKKKNSRGIVMSLLAGKHYSKPNPANFQQKLLKLYENNLTDIFNQYEHTSGITKQML